MEFPKNFFDEEIRSGFKVTTGRKKLWAECLNIFEEFKRICDKYHLQWSATGGSLLGAVRDKGFIPWDDDIDLAMWREDYELFCKVAPVELKHPYFLQTAYNDEDWCYFFGRIRNSETTATARYDLQFKFNKGIYLDIFPIDKLPDDEAEREEIKAEVLKLRRMLFVGVKKFWYFGDEIITEEEKKTVAEYIEKYGWKKNCLHMEDICRQYNMRDTKECGYTHSYVARGVRYDCDAINETIEVPFEHTTILIPKGYDMVLSRLYGDYMKPVQGAGLHGKLMVSTEVPYYRFDPEKDAFEL